MAKELHKALETLAPVQWDDVPLDSLAEYMQNAFSNGELIANSVPPPPNGEPFHASKPHHNRPNLAKSAKEMHVSSARGHRPHKDHESLNSAWGKPVVKVGGDKNPLHVTLYKMAGHDRHGAWFARRSVHEGLGFTKWKRAMMREFPQSLSVQGGPGAGAVRGLAADRRIEQRHVEGVGEMEVYQLSSAFPGPVAPRDFVTMVMTTESEGLSEKSGVSSEEGNGEGGGEHVPRHYMIVSIPVTHPDTPERSGFVRGKYESVELIREIPLHRRKGAAQDGAAHGSTDNDEAELNPVEWIMVTRSDPGGGLPRFLVERGTPEPMLNDVPKFLNWATGLDEIPDKDADVEQISPATDATQDEKRPSAPNGLPNGATLAVQEDPVQRSSSAPVSRDQQQEGLFSSMAHTLETGIGAYAPTGVTTQLHNYLHPTHAPINNEEDLDDDESDTSSSDSGSFISATEMRRMSTADGEGMPRDSAENLSIASANSSSEVLAGKKHLNPHEKEVQKIMREREKLDRKLAKKRLDEENRLKKSQEKEKGEEDKARERHEREMQKAEEKHRKEVEKLEQKRNKEEQRRRKREERHNISLVARERDEVRAQLDTFKRENSLLLERVEELQRENTVMANKLGKLGPEVLKSVQEEVAGLRKRTTSVKSNESKKSMDSARS